MKQKIVHDSQGFYTSQVVSQISEPSTVSYKHSYILTLSPCHQIFAKNKKNNPIHQPSSCSSHPNRFTSPQLLDHSNQRRRFFEAPRRLRRHRRWNGTSGRGGRVVEAGGWTVPAAPWGARVIHGKASMVGGCFL